MAIRLKAVIEHADGTLSEVDRIVTEAELADGRFSALAGDVVRVLSLSLWEETDSDSTAPR